MVGVALAEVVVLEPVPVIPRLIKCQANLADGDHIAGLEAGRASNHAVIDFYPAAQIFDHKLPL